MSTVGDFLTDYYEVFSSCDLPAILTHFHVPAVFIGPAGVFPLPDSAALTAMFTRTIDDLRARGYGRSEFVLEEEKALGEVSTFVSGIAVRYNTDGEVLERVPLSYIVQKSYDGWKIAILILHAAK